MWLATGLVQTLNWIDSQTKPSRKQFSIITLETHLKASTN